MIVCCKNVCASDTSQIISNFVVFSRSFGAPFYQPYHMMRRGFIGLAQQNQELVKLNKQLTQQLETVVEELNQIKQERQEKAARKEVWANRKRFPKRPQKFTKP